MCDSKAQPTTDLVARLEGAKEGSRGLDWECHKAAFPWLQKATSYSLGYVDVDGANDPDALLWYSADREQPYHDKLPHYTTSLDHALTLVPNGSYAKLQLSRNHKKAWAWVEMAEVEAVAHSTPALALCIASLKARAAIAKATRDSQ